jgi:hypothetical protein
MSPEWGQMPAAFTTLSDSTCGHVVCSSLATDCQSLEPVILNTGPCCMCVCEMWLSRHYKNVTNYLLLRIAWSKIFRFLYIPSDDYRVHNSWPLDPVLSQMNPVHTLIPCSFRIQLEYCILTSFVGPSPP